MDGVGSVAGSRFLLERKGPRMLVDCGLFLDLKNLRLRKWSPFPVKPKSVAAIVLNFARIDHSGYPSTFTRDGF